MDVKQKRCFVVMGFGIKTDFATGRKLDLNKSYRLLVKPVIEAKGLICTRADEIPHSGAIDIPMYLELLQADVVVADLSTANPNALYELGVRHALRPRTTIVISEDKMPYPFDLNHIKITSYNHLGDAIDFEEVERFRKVLGETLDSVLNIEDVDSPVYTFLNLVPPALVEKLTRNIIQTVAPDTSPVDEPQNIQTLSLLTEQGEAALSKNQFMDARSFFTTALLMGKHDMGYGKMGVNAYLIHRLTLATYKSKEPNEVTALNDALLLLHELDLEHTNDPETVALAGAIEKRLYEKSQDEQHLSAAILYYQRGYYLLNNRYNGINLAFMLDYRAQSSLCTSKYERIADLVSANRIRKEVLIMCEKDWIEITNRQNKNLINESLLKNDDFSINQQKADKEQLFWILINKAEANFGLGNIEAYEKAVATAALIEHDNWMMSSMEEQIEKLKTMIKNQELMQE